MLFSAPEKSRLKCLGYRVFAHRDIWASLNIQHTGIRVTKVSILTQGTGYLEIPCEKSGFWEYD